MCDHKYNERNYISCPVCYVCDKSMRAAYYISIGYIGPFSTDLKMAASVYYRNRHRGVDNREVVVNTNEVDAGVLRYRLTNRLGFIFEKLDIGVFRLKGINPIVK